MKKILTICFGFVLLALITPTEVAAQVKSPADSEVVTNVPTDDVVVDDDASKDVDSDSDDDDTTVKMSFWKLFKAGGFLMWVLVLLACVMIFIFVERFLAIRNASQIDSDFMNRIRDYISEGNIDAAMDLCRRTNSPIARMIEKGIERIGRPMSDIQTTIENVANVEVAKLETSLPWLASISGGAPMIGFMGTVIGMVGVFIDMSGNQGGGVQIADLSAGMYTAMVTTVGGLAVGIPAYFAHNYLVARIEKLIFRMEATSIAFMDILNQPVQE